MPEASPTQDLARYVAEAEPEALPASVRHEMARGLVNWMACAVGGSRHEAVDRALDALLPFSGGADAQVLGRPQRLSAPMAALVNGVAGHVLDYDDTHPRTIIHPVGPVAAALLALAETRQISGPAFVNALALGVEAECRVGAAVSPEHRQRGWHITGTCGALGAAAACGKLLALDAGQMACALGVAASQPVGLGVNVGTMTKSLHAGRAAETGLTAALLAARGFTASPAALEGRDGWGTTLSARQDWREVTDGLGQRFEGLQNTYKPFACGVVTHAAVDAIIRLRNAHGLRPEQVETLSLHTNPLVQRLTGRLDPQTGLDGKFSMSQIAAVALREGAAGPAQFTDAAVHDPVNVALRRRVLVVPDPAMPAEAAEAVVRLFDGRTLLARVDHALGSLANPMSDEALAGKFLDLADGVLPQAKARRLLDLCWSIWAVEDAGALARAAASQAHP